MKRAEIALMFSLVAFVFALVQTHDQAEAHPTDYGFTWHSNTYANAGVVDSTSTSNWSTQIAFGLWYWYNDTDLWAHEAAGTIVYYSGNYGNSGWYGAASVWSGPTLCISVGYNSWACNHPQSEPTMRHFR